MAENARAAAPAPPAQSAEPERSLDLLLVGGVGVGKTSLVKRYMKNRFTRDSYAISLVEKTARIIDIEGESVRLVVCDVGGQARYGTMRERLYERADGVIFVYDATSAQSLLDVQKIAIELRAAAKHTPEACVLVGTHADAPAAPPARASAHPIDPAATLCREVPASAGAAAAAKLDMAHIEASSLSGLGVIDAFEIVARHIVGRRREAENDAAEAAEAENSGATLLRRIDGDADGGAGAGAAPAPRRGWRRLFCCC